MNNDKFKKILAFCVLMGNEKILTKSPDYIMEKFDRYINSGQPDAYLWGLDSDNTEIFENYLKQWFKEQQ